MVSADKIIRSFSQLADKHKNNQLVEFLINQRKHQQNRNTRQGQSIHKTSCFNVKMMTTSNLYIQTPKAKKSKDLS